MDNTINNKPVLILPKLRSDLAYEEAEENEQKYLILFDTNKYVETPIELPMQFLPMLQHFDGKTEIDTLIRTMRSIYNLAIDEDLVIEVLRRLDDYGFLDTPRFHWTKYQIDVYRNSDSRPPICISNTYPANPNELKKYIDAIMSATPRNGATSNVKGIIVPHIDFKVGLNAHKAYSAGYRAIEDSEADLFVIFGTAHFANSDNFMLTKKNFNTPLGTVETDQEILDKLEHALPDQKLNYDDMAHRNEHSIELQTVLLKHVFADRPFKILPILTGSYYGFVQDKLQPGDDNYISVFLDTLKRVLDESGKKVIYIASADFAHIGRKFGDNFDAAGQLQSLRDDDHGLIEKLSGCDESGFFDIVAQMEDSRRICGLSPIYSLLYTLKPEKGQFLGYYQWNEVATASAVSFASLAYY